MFAVQVVKDEIDLSIKDFFHLSVVYTKPTCVDSAHWPVPSSIVVYGSVSLSAT